MPRTTEPAVGAQAPAIVATSRCGCACIAAVVFLLSVLAPVSGSAQTPLMPGEEAQYEAHIAYVKSLVEREPSLPHHYLRLARAYAQIGREGEVLRYVDEANKRGADRMAGDILLGDFYSSQDRHADALTRYLRVLKRSPQQTYVLTQVWLIVQSARTQKLSLPVDLNTLIDLVVTQGFFVSVSPPTFATKKAKRALREGNRLLSSGDPMGALAEYRRAASHDPWLARIYRGMGIAHAKLARERDAIGAYTLYTVLAPPGTSDVPRVREIIYDYYERRGRVRR